MVGEGQADPRQGERNRQASMKKVTPGNEEQLAIIALSSSDLDTDKLACACVNSLGHCQYPQERFEYCEVFYRFVISQQHLNILVL